MGDIHYNEPRAVVIESLDTYLQSTFIELLLYGIYVAIFFVTVYAMFFCKGKQPPPKWMACVVVIQFTLATLHVGQRWYYIRETFIFHSSNPNASLDYAWGLPLWEGILAISVVLVNMLITDCVMIWKCYKVWGGSWKIILVPSLATLACTAISINLIYLSSRANITDGYVWSFDLNTPFYILSMFNNVLVTGLILFPVIRSMHNLRNAFGRGSSSQSGGSGRYGALIEVLVESAALYSTTLLALAVISLVIKHTTAGIHAITSYRYTFAILVQVTGIAPTLIAARLSLGMARKDQTWNSNSGATAPAQLGGPLRFAPPTVTRTTASRGSQYPAVLEMVGSNSDSSRSLDAAVEKVWEHKKVEGNAGNV